MAPMKAMLPIAPKIHAVPGPIQSDDLSQVPEIAFQAQAKKGGNERSIVKAAEQLAKINHANGQKVDGFMKALIENRPDLAGLPFAMGDPCRSTGARVLAFNMAARTVQRVIGNLLPQRQPAVSISAVATEPIAVLLIGDQPKYNSITKTYPETRVGAIGPLQNS